MIEMKIQGLTADSTLHRTLLWLAGTRSDVLFPIVLEARHAAAIFASAAVVADAPVIHDLIRVLKERMRQRPIAIHIVGGDTGKPKALLVLDSSGRDESRELGAGDAMVLAIQKQIPIFLEEQAYQRLGAQIPALEGGALADGPALPAFTDDEIDTAIDQLLEELGGATEVVDSVDPVERLSRLKKRLKQSVQLEQYEDAGNLRNQIRDIERELG